MRLDRLIDDIRRRFHQPAAEAPGDDASPPDVVIVAHGHILRALAMRWIGKSLNDGLSFLLEAGGVGTLRYIFLDDPQPLLTLRLAMNIIIFKSLRCCSEEHLWSTRFEVRQEQVALSSFDFDIRHLAYRLKLVGESRSFHREVVKYEMTCSCYSLRSNDRTVVKFNLGTYNNVPIFS